MRRRPQTPDQPAIAFKEPILESEQALGLVLSGGGSRAAYQVGALKALSPYLQRSKQPLSVIIGSSIGAVNSLLLGVCMKNGFDDALREVEDLWRERTFRNTFAGSPSLAFFRAIRMGIMQYLSPGPNATPTAIFDPSPLMKQLDGLINTNGGLSPESRDPNLKAVGVMTTVEGTERKPLLFLSTHHRLPEETLEGASFEVCYVDSLSAKHGFASAALPSVLPPVELDTDRGKVRLVDGGISQNVPVDPAVRVGAERVLVVDVSGRDWWLNRYNEAHDTRPTWEVPASLKTFCIRPPETFVVRCKKPLGPIVKESVGMSTKKFISAIGPTWPVFQLLKNKMGEEVAYEVMSYVTLHPDYIAGLIERGYQEATEILKARALTFQRSETFAQWASDL